MGWRVRWSVIHSRRMSRAAHPLIWIVAALLLGGCFRKVASTRFPASTLAQVKGVTGYDIARADKADLDVSLEGLAGRLRVQVLGDLVTQSLDLPGRSTFVLQTSADWIDVAANGARRRLAARQGADWLAGEPVAPEWLPRLALLLAVDTDLGVQGASMIRDGRAYVFCTWNCERATSCLDRGDLLPCAPALTTCAACLEQEP